MATVSFSKEEIQIIFKLFDTAARAAGLSAANEALPILHKIEVASQQKEDNENSPQS